MTESKMLNNAVATVAGRELTMTRVFQSPREIVYQAWTDPRHLSHWWGPEGFTITTRSIDVTPGGVWSYVMHGPDGLDYINRIQYIEVVRPERLVYSHGDDEEEERFRVTVTMEEKGNAMTQLTMRMVFPTAEELEETVRKYGAIEGAQSTLARLAEELEAVKAANLEITRTFNAPRELVFKAWTDSGHLQHWWGPKGFDINIFKFDLQPGGLFLYSMSQDGHRMWGKFVFHEIAAPAKLVFVNSFSDPEGNTVRPPFSEQFPLEILNILTFTEQDGQTTVTMRGGPIHATEEEVEFFKSMHPSMQEGFGSTFAQLDEYLVKL